ncbi:LOW QUALITY PROTEIN: uncharacterized protein Hmr [Drosophila tropicalis]|uniref:LOW QUALITY PROTEIN: uncharacterized protein Hmr n=1 Tax=Drosophila tropicalis TaxID=46794 RepID=UPI0035ABC5C0
MEKEHPIAEEEETEVKPTEEELSNLKQQTNVLPTTLEKLKLERRLIVLVGKQGALYDTSHPRFTDDLYKEELWQSIANQLSLDLTQCLSSWAELRYKYQKHVRRLRNYRRMIVQPIGAANRRRRRPVMLHEEDMMFLYDHVAKLPLKRTPKMPVESLGNDEDDLEVVVTNPANEIIDVDLMADKDVNEFQCTEEHRRLVEAVKSYPQLYDIYRPGYDNYRHRGLIWGSISNELRDKATKLMKRWLYLQTRYEWELGRTVNGVQNSELWHLLSFLAPHVHQMPNTVCKSSLYLQNGWFDPIEHFRTVTTLINTIKGMPELLKLVDLNIPVIQKLPRYHDLWLKVASVVNCSYQRCEITWLTLRCFHQELSEMRKCGYLLQDKWYFENVIGTMYKQMQMQQQLPMHRLSQSMPASSKHKPNVGTGTSTTPLATFSMLTSPMNNPMPTVNPPRLPLAIVYPPSATKESTSTSTITTTATTTITAAAQLTGNPNISISKISASINLVPISVNSNTNPIASPSSTTSGTSTSSPGFVTPISLSASTLANTLTPNGFTPLPIPTTTNAIQSVMRNGLQVVVRPRACPSTVAPPVLAPIAAANAPVAIIRGVPIPTTPTAGPSTLSAATTSTAMASTTAIHNVATLLGSPVPKMPKLVPITSVRTDRAAVAKINSATAQMPQSSTGTATTTLSADGGSSVGGTQLVRVHQSALNSGWDGLGPANIALATLPAIAPAVESPFSDIKVELVESLEAGNSLHVWSNSQVFHYHLNMSRTGSFIREIMAIPQLHSKNPQLICKCAEFWQQISKKFHMPEVACKACWSFLLENMSVFPKIASMSDLMRPIKTSIKVWEKSHRLFSKFDEIARKYQWMHYKDKLPALMQHFSRYDHLYWELRKPRPGEPIPTPQKYTEQERLEVWRSAREKFPNMNHRDIWSMFKFAFRTYMEDLERGVENPWPQNWWQALEQLKFLVDVRYHPLEPYYYIVHQKFLEEVKRCSIYESLMSGSTDKSTAISSVQMNKMSRFCMPWDTEEAKRLLTGRLTTTSLSSINDNDVPPYRCRLYMPPWCPLMEYSIQDENVSRLPKLVRHMERTSRPLPTISPYQLTRVLRDHPHTFEKATTLEKRTAWVRVAKDLDTTVTECRLSLQHALRELRILKVRDPGCRSPLNHKYYRHMGEIYRLVRPHSSLTMRNALELNKTPLENKETIYPERYIPEINMITCKPRLVLKNLAFAMGNFSMVVQEELKVKLKQIFARYAEEANLTWPIDGPIKRKTNGATNNSVKRFKPDTNT